MDVSKSSAALIQAALLLAVSCGSATAARHSAQKKPQGPQQAASNPQSPPQSPAPPAPREQQVISAAQNDYESGMRNYHAGDLAAAKRDFDTAVDTILSSGLDLKTSPPLSDEFEHIVDAVNALEMDALKRGNGFSPAVEPSPAEVANDVTFEVDPNLVAILMTGYGTIDTAVQAMKEGAHDYILKPFKLSAILPVLNRALAIRRLRLENIQLHQAVAIYELSMAIALAPDSDAILQKVYSPPPYGLSYTVTPYRFVL